MKDRFANIRYKPETIFLSINLFTNKLLVSFNFLFILQKIDVVQWKELGADLPNFRKFSSFREVNIKKFRLS